MRVINIEHKSTSADIGPGSPYWKRLIIDGQISVYKTGTRALGYDPVGTLYDVIKKPTLRPMRATPVDDRKYTQEKSKACPECKKKKGATPAPHMIEVGEKSEDTDVVEVRLVACQEGRVVTDPGGKLYANMREHDESPGEYAERLRADIAANPDKYYQRGLVVRLEQELVDAGRDAWELGRQIRESQLENRWPRNPEACETYGSFCSYWDVCTGAATIDDPTRFRNAESAHEELVVDDGKRRLPLLSASSMRTYRSCPRKYFYAYEQRRRAIEDHEALRFGTLMHRGLEVWWTTVDLEKALAAMRASYFGLGIDNVEAIKAEALMAGYHVRWKDEPLEVLAVEQQFVAPLVNPKTGSESKTWELGGKIDAIVRAPESATAAA